MAQILFSFNNEERGRLHVALVRAQGDILYQLENVKSDRKMLVEEYEDLEKLAGIIQRSFK